MENGERLDVSVLYVEDEADTREAVGAMLRRRVRALALAADGSEGLRAFLAQRPEVVVTDVRMPAMSGLELARAIKREDPEVQVVVTTAHGETDVLVEAIDAGVDRYLIKPVVREKLFAAVEACARVALAAREARRAAAERERLIGELQAALSKVKLLSGMLPICASCKKIRNDRGYWEQIEVFVREHSEAEFSHGLCPECAERIYPEYCRRGAPGDAGSTG